MDAHVAYHCMPCIECIECIVRYRALLCAIGGYVTIRHRDGFVALLMSCSGCATVPTVATVAVCPEAFAEELP